MINHEAASAFVNSIEDPIVRDLVRHSYVIILMSEAFPQGDFDLLYFFRIMEEFLRDREKLAMWLKGEYGEDKTGWGT
jgi:hypothetical protein